MRRLREALKVGRCRAGASSLNAGRPSDVAPSRGSRVDDGQALVGVEDRGDLDASRRRRFASRQVPARRSHEHAAMRREDGKAAGGARDLLAAARTARARATTPGGRGSSARLRVYLTGFGASASRLAPRRGLLSFERMAGHAAVREAVAAGDADETPVTETPSSHAPVREYEARASPGCHRGPGGAQELRPHGGKDVIDAARWARRCAPRAARRASDSDHAAPMRGARGPDSAGRARVTDGARTVFGEGRRARTRSPPWPLRYPTRRSC